VGELMPGLNFQGADIGRSRASSASACLRKCEQQRGCHAMTFIDSESSRKSRCYFKGKKFARDPQYSAGTVSGVVAHVTARQSAAAEASRADSPKAIKERIAAKRSVSHYSVLPEHKLILCRIEKVMNTALTDLLCSLTKRILRRRKLPKRVKLKGGMEFEQGCHWSSNFPEVRGMSACQLQQALSDPKWTRVAFVRDPLERFLSAFISKCETGHDADTYMCAHVFESEQPSLRHAVQVISKASSPMPLGVAWDHWRPQSEFCGGRLRDQFQLITGVNRSSSHALVGGLLRHIGVDPIKQPAFLHHFGVEATRRPDKHRTLASEPEARARFYKHADLVRALLLRYASDYHDLRLLIPHWAAEIAGPKFMARLATRQQSVAASSIRVNAPETEGLNSTCSQ